MAKKSFIELLTGADNIGEPRRKKKKNMRKTKKEETIIEKDITDTDAVSSISEGQLTVDVYQTDSDVVIKSTIAGVKPEDLDVSINNDMVTIKGRREKDEVINEDDYYYQECYWGNFSRSIILPIDIEADKSEASIKNGILTIRLPKTAKVKTKKIEVTEE